MAPPEKLDFDTIQGDILGGLPKKHQSFVFFTINDSKVDEFRERLKNFVVPLITTAAQARWARADIVENKLQYGNKAELIKLACMNIAFTQEGLNKLGIDPQTLCDDDFYEGQANSASALGDPAWDPESPFKKLIHGCFNITGESEGTIQDRIKVLEVDLFNVTTTVHRVDGAVRPEPNKGHKHFGFQDGLSQPAVSPFRLPDAGEATTEAGVILLCHSGDTKIKTRPSWAKGSSFMVFRQLQQFVPEFKKFLKDEAARSDPPMQAELLGARMMGRWVSGASVERNPFADNPQDADDINKVNQFDYITEIDLSVKFNVETLQLKCPFASHLRKMNSRAGLSVPFMQTLRITRQGIPYGPELTAEEKNGPSTIKNRGLLFVCYQSTLSLGFVFFQKKWANAIKFPNEEDGVEHGLDPIIGQLLITDDPKNRFTTGMNPANLTEKLALPVMPFVKPIGGVYMISPSVDALSGYPFATTLLVGA